MRFEREEWACVSYKKSIPNGGVFRRVSFISIISFRTALNVDSPPTVVRALLFQLYDAPSIEKNAVFRLHYTFRIAAIVRN